MKKERIDEDMKSLPKFLHRREVLSGVIALLQGHMKLQYCGSGKGTVPVSDVHCWHKEESLNCFRLADHFGSNGFHKGRRHYWKVCPLLIHKLTLPSKKTYYKLLVCVRGVWKPITLRPSPFQSGGQVHWLQYRRGWGPSLRSSLLHFLHCRGRRVRARASRPRGYNVVVIDLSGLKNLGAYRHAPCSVVQSKTWYELLAVKIEWVVEPVMEEDTVISED